MRGSNSIALIFDEQNIGFYGDKITCLEWLPFPSPEYPRSEFLQIKLTVGCTAELHHWPLEKISAQIRR